MLNSFESHKTERVVIPGGLTSVLQPFRMFVLKILQRQSQKEVAVGGRQKY